MPPKTESFQKRRETTMAQVEAIVEYASKLSDSSDIDEIQARLDNLPLLMRSFTDAENDLFTKDSETESLSKTFDEKYYTAVAKLSSWIRKNAPTTSHSFNHTAHNEGHFSASILNNSHSEVKLPRLNLPTFNGNYQEWQSFLDMFKATVHENPSLSGVQKFQYLMGSLKGEASALLKHLPITEMNYTEAYQKLIKRYSKKKLILTTFIKTFMNQPTIKNLTSHHIRNISDTSDEIIRGVKAMGTNAENRDPWLIYIVLMKLDDDTQQRWAEESNATDFPTWSEFLDFLNKRADALENCEHPSSKKAQPSPTIRSHTTNTITKPNCPLCDIPHFLFECIKFKELDVDNRREFMQKGNRCYNCLSDTHLVTKCKSKRSCLKCHKRHNTLLHKNYEQHLNPEQPLQPQGESTSKTTSLLLPTTQPSMARGLLQTAVINVLGSDNIRYPCKALLDSGSLASFITESCVQKLNLPRQNHRLIVQGIASTTVGATRGLVSLDVQSAALPCKLFKMEALVMSKITSKQPELELRSNYWKEFEKLALADPSYYKPGEIDILIGCDQYLSLLLPGHIESSNSNLIAQETILGWVISGTISTKSNSEVTSLCTSINIDQSLTKFWELDQIKPTTPTQSPNDIYCEEHFINNFCLNSDGRYVVALPFAPDAMPLGEMKSQALKRLQSVERRLARDPNLKRQYNEFMHEYEMLGHMTKVSSNEFGTPAHKSYYLPHHSIYKETSTTTKLRVVFDGSAKTRSGISLNENLLAGPQIQQSLQETLQRFRFHRFVMTADLEKMFRQILLKQPDTEFQRILWRHEITDPVQEYKLLTVTYGTTSAPFLSTRVLKQIAIDNRQVYPVAAKIIERDFYVDDLMTGCDTIEELIDLKSTIDIIMKNAGFNLRKWLSNVPEIHAASQIPNKLIEIAKDSNYTKVLGMHWDPVSDNFSYRITFDENPILTKRGMLSEASKLFDPLGWLSPITIFIKILFQKTWTKGLEWDDQLPQDIRDDWLKFRTQAKQIESTIIPRWLNFTSDEIILHGFADASQFAYAAVIYAVNTNLSQVTIITAKTRVAPVKKLITIAKLELCAAHLLSSLMKNTETLLEDRKHSVYLWSDSTIVLQWLETLPRSLDTFVGNRVSQIIDNHPRSLWHHITSSQNPADCASRGILPNELPSHNLWWTGPLWLKESNTNWPIKQNSTIGCNLSTASSVLSEIVSKNSNFNKIIRIIAYCKRFIKNYFSKSDQRVKDFLKCSELNNSKLILIKWVQEINFYNEIKTLNNKQQLSKDNKLINLNLILDNNGILRVGGRIEHATVPYDVKHPILLPSDDIVTEIRATHHALLCANHTLLNTTLKQNYWIINAKLIIRRVIKSCVKCARYNVNPIQPMMASLPANRVSLVRPFYSTGVDYAGPILVRPSKRRGLKPDKAYIAVFICLSTKAIHLELAGDMSTDTFISVFRRFISRRGLCHDITSDNGSNFIGAKRDLDELFNIINDNNISNFLSQNQIIWKFNPPTGSHFGGIYEAAVKSTKYHLKRTLSESLLTYEEMSTLLIQIEAILNSRSLYVSSDDDINPLTPAHFFIGHPFTSLPDPDVTHLKLNHLSRWQYIQRLRQDFWKKWHTCYLTSLQKRKKWQINSTQIKINDIVLINDNNLPPNKWHLGRVIATHPGPDKIIRVVTLKTSSGTLKRPVNKLSILPVDG